MGNLVYRGTQRQFNPIMAMAARITIAEVDRIVDTGELDPDSIVTPGIFVKRIVKVQKDPGFPRHLERGFQVKRAQ
jgi:acyl CoA:acetate/3-ketoacid CoA transferase alpha subunit